MDNGDLNYIQSDSTSPSTNQIMEYMLVRSNSLPYYRVSDLVEATGLTRPTVQKALNQLVMLGKVKKSGYKQRIGHVYTPVDNEKFGVFIGENTYNLEELLHYISTSHSPHKMVAEEQWRNFMKIFMCLVLQSEEDVPYKLEDVMTTLNMLRNETIELTRLLNVMLQDFDSEVNKMLIERELASMKSGSKFSATNYINDVMGSGRKVA